MDDMLSEVIVTIVCACLEQCGVFHRFATEFSSVEEEYARSRAFAAQIARRLAWKME